MRGADDPNFIDQSWTQDWINRSYMSCPEDQPQAKTFGLGMQFIRENHDADNWFLQIETFDPHEPFFTHQEFKNLYPQVFDELPPDLPSDWPTYKPVTESPEYVQHMRYQYTALLSMRDRYLGHLLDLMDEYKVWEDTLLIVCADHDFLLGGHDWWAKNKQPWYNELAHTPLFIWDPRSRIASERRDSLAQMIDLPATLLEYFGVELPPDMQGKSLQDTIANDTAVREAALFGVFGGHVNCTGGKYVYMWAPANPASEPLYEYTLMTMHLRALFSTEELQGVQLAEPFSFTKGCRIMKIPGRAWADTHPFGTLLLDVELDPAQKNSLDDSEIETRMIDLNGRFDARLQ